MRDSVIAGRWAASANLHLHLHCVVPGGGLGLQRHPEFEFCEMQLTKVTQTGLHSNAHKPLRPFTA
jgi:hypothetical protein